MIKSAANSVATIDQFLSRLGTVKQADAPKSEAGSIGGETSHPVKKVDDRLKDAPEGERFKENTKDVNEDQGAASVQKAPEATAKSAAASIFGLAAKFAKKAEGGAVSTPGSAADDHISTTTTVSATGEDPKTETGSAKAGKEDKEQGGVGGTKHPASTENNSIDGHKWAADTPLEKLSNDMSALGNSLLTLMHGAYQNAGQQPPAQTKAAAAQAPQASQLAFQAGHELAGLLNGTFDKKAADAMVHRALTETIKQASDDADMFVHYANNYFKQAEDEAEGSADPAAGGGGEDPMAAMAGGGGGGDPMGGGGGGGDPGAMLGALGGGAGAGDPSGGMGGGGGDPMGGGGGGGDAEAQQLAMILEQLGVTPEELQAAMEAEAAGGGGGMGGGMGGGDPAAAMGGGGAAAPPGGGGGGMGGGMEAQAGAGRGKTNLSKEATSQMTTYIRELASRSRFKK